MDKSIGIAKDNRRPFEGIPPPRVFFVRVANTGVMLDAARKSGKCRT